MGKDIVMAGSYGGKSKNMATTSVVIGDTIAIDAGNILNYLGDSAYKIDHVFLTHSHYDHILDIPFLIDVFFEKRGYPLTVYGSAETLEDLKKYVFNWKVWPDFNEISLIKSQEKAIRFQPIVAGEVIEVDGVTLEAVPSNHTVTCFGYVVKNKEGRGVYFTSDTYASDAIWERVNSDEGIEKLITDVSFPSRLDKLAHDSRHMTPKILKEELAKLKREIELYIYHLKPSYYYELIRELRDVMPTASYKVLSDGFHIDTL